MNKWILTAGLALATGCSGTFESAAMKLHYEPPRGVKLTEEVAGPPQIARFSSGLEIRSVEAPPPAVDEAHLEPLLAVVTSKSGLTTTGVIISARPGTLPAGKVVRWTLKDGETRSLIYFLPAGKRFLVLSLSSTESGSATLENQLELSLGSLKLRE